MKSIVKQHIKFFRPALIILLSFIILAFSALSFIYYKLSNSLVHKRNLEHIEVSLDKNEFSYEEVAFKSKEDNITLRGVFFPAKISSNKTLVIVHGFNLNRMMDGYTEKIVKYFTPKGYNVLTFDLRGEGMSEGNLISFGYYEKYDVMGAIDYLKSRGKEGDKIALIGFSMGATTVIETAENDIRVDAIIADSPFRDLRIFILKDLAALSYDSNTIPNDLIMDLPYWHIQRYIPFKDKFISIAAKLYDIRIDEVSPMNAVKSISGKPIFLIHGKNDKLIPYSNSEVIYESIEKNNYTKLWLTEGAGHIESFEMNPDEYLEGIKAFLDKTMSN